MSLIVGGIIKKTWKSRILLALDHFLRGFYPLWLNKWIFNHMDYETKNGEQK